MATITEAQEWEKLSYKEKNHQVYLYGQSENPLLFCSVSLTSL